VYSLLILLSMKVSWAVLLLWRLDVLDVIFALLIDLSFVDPSSCP
jgi:hypothetical protein